MVINLDPQLEAALREASGRLGVSPQLLAVGTLRERFLGKELLLPRDDWERGLLAAAQDCGVSLSNEQLSSEGIYD